MFAMLAMLDSFFIFNKVPADAHRGEYQIALVILSYLVASFASYTALALAQQLVDTKNSRERYWLHWGGAFAMGAGIWSMHFIGMLSYKMTMAVAYEPFLTLLSMLIAITVAYGVLGIVARDRLSLKQIAVGAVLLGAGISSMHYTGMAAMHMDGDLRYRPDIFLLSIIIAIAASGTALWMTFTLMRSNNVYHYLLQAGASLIMGAAICGMHYTGMAALVFIPYEHNHAEVNQSPDVLAVSIAVMTSVILGIALAAGAYKRAKVEEALRDADHRKDEFLSTLAHELRNPLAPISMALSMLQSPELDEQKRAKSCGIIERQLKQINRLVDDLVDLSRITHGKIELRKQPIMLSEAIDIALETVKPVVNQHGHTLTIYAPKEPIWLDADRTRLAQIFINLINNAAKYTLPNGVITLEAKRSEDKGVVVKVRDTGIGIPANKLQHIFELFVQLETSLERSHGGLGIGLTLVKRLVELHGGTIEAQSEGAERGSEFIVCLPTILTPELAPRVETQMLPEAVCKPRVLVTDDNIAFTETLGAMLEMLGYEVQVTNDGASALAAAQTFVPEIILLDIGMPGMNGYDVCKRMRAMPALRDSLIIAQTGFSQPDYFERSKAAGFDHHLIKPVNIHVIERLLQSFNLSRRAGVDHAF